MRSRHDFGPQPYSDYSGDWGVTEVIGPQPGTRGLFFVVRNGHRFAVIASDSTEAAFATWQRDFWGVICRRFGFDPK